MWIEYEGDYESYVGSFCNYPIYTTITSDPICISAWISDVMQSKNPFDHLIVGFGAEWCPDASVGEENTIGAIQLCVGDRCLVYQILHSPFIPAALSEFLSDDFNTFVGVGVKEGLDRLQREYGIGGDEAWKEELGELAATATGMDEYRSKELETLAICVLDVEIEVEKSARDRMSRWDNKHLSLDQIIYASLHAYLSFQIGAQLIKDDPIYSF